MSDGPHKTLPLPCPWKKVAEIACEPATPLEDLLAVFAAAMIKTLMDALPNSPIDRVVAVGLEQISLDENPDVPFGLGTESAPTSPQPVLDERGRRIWAGAEAQAIGRGGIARVSEATGLARDTVRAGLREVRSGAPGRARSPGGRLRRPGGGRKSLVERDPDLLAALDRLLEPVTRGDPMSPLSWTCLSAARLADALRAEGHPVSGRSVNRLLHRLGYSLQANRKRLEGRQHPGRDAQFRRIDRKVREFQDAGQPVVSVDTKKKELVGKYRSGGRRASRRR